MKWHPPMVKFVQHMRDQGYTDKPVAPVCKHCAHFTYEVREVTNESFAWLVVKNRRCGIGWFNVKGDGSCQKFTWAEGISP